MRQAPFCGRIRSLTAPQCVFGVMANGATQPDNMGVFELEDSALVAMRAWITQGVAPPSGNQIATTPFFNIVERDQFGNALGGIGCRTSTCRPRPTRRSTSPSRARRA